MRGRHIGITWAGSDTFLHGVRVVASDATNMPARQRPSTLTPYQPVREHAACGMSTPRQPLGRPVCLVVPDAPSHRQEGRESYRLAAPIQRFNNKSLNWPAWFRHFRAVVDVHGWDKSQRALQPVSYMDETAMNVVQELGDDELYDYDILVKLLDCWVNNLCGTVRPGAKKYLWVVIRTKKDRKLQTLIEVCTDFASLSPTGNVHRPAEHTFAVEEDEISDEMFAMMDRSQWTGQGVSEPNLPPSMAQMFALARKMGHEMRPVARRSTQPPGSPHPPFPSGQGYRQPFRQGRDFSRTKCFSCGQMGHTQARCPKPDATLPFKPPGWNMQSTKKQ